ncbi:NAD-dependent epimerase/dehydratase family protein [Pseudomonas sp. RIT-PI-AD]|uniref:NAD-dependent epimerase/dehydratase family protein n=1 Tax=Pseudomonas sp. RIT-PI-AD TaxID=3035294 RepID=UPI0021D8ECCE|nr:NAD-dependent epimerase/dehydratase family protein [Pseudomonas sp. RIT-PI-AD]
MHTPDGSDTRILLAGSSGFIGGAIRRALQRRGAEPRLLLRRPSADAAPQASGDLTDAGSLRGCCEGIETLIHAASAVDADEARCQAVNVEGTRNLLQEARRAGVSRVIYLSTAAVYGEGAHRDLREDELQPAPVSATSRTRLQAEQLVLQAGGVVLRPFLVYGDGDRWFIPALVGLLRRYPVTLEGGAAQLSLVAVDDLAESVAALALEARDEDRGRVYHVGPERPVALRELLAVLHRQGLAPATQADLPYAQAVEATRTLGSAVARQLSLIAFDHVYDSQALRSRTGVRPAAFAEGFARYAEAYARALASG